MLRQTTFEIFNSATSSPELAAGPTPCASPVSPMTPKSGPAPARASRLAALEKDWARLTKDTSGLISETSSRSVALQLSLANRLQARLDVNGSPEYALTWKLWPMRSGPQICALRASRHRISGNGFTGWPTPNTAPDAPNGSLNRGNGKLRARLTHQSVMAIMVGRQTPTVQDGCGRDRHNQKNGTVILSLLGEANLAGWSTPSSRDHKDTPGMATEGINPDGTTRSRLDQLPRQVTLIFGPTQSGTGAETEKRVAYLLNPAFSLWLQGYPEEWLYCGALAIASFLNLHRNLSKRTSKP